MSFVSLGYLPFLALTLLCLLIPAKKRWMMLLPASWFFYGCHSWKLLSLLILTTAVSFGCAIWMEHASRRSHKRRILLLGTSVCLGILFLFKYLDFSLLSIFRLFNRADSFRSINLVLPMGISFYTFQTVSYLIDVYRGTLTARRHFGIYALYVSFFPQLVAGPIERAGTLLPQLENPSLPNSADLVRSVQLIVKGYTKKILIADLLAPIVDAAYSAPAKAGGAAMAAATILFAVQIFCDFSGYTDIARGSAGLLGIRLSENFDCPYEAVSVRDFWRRWHITLTSWFRDYVYIPLGGNRKGPARHCINLCFVFLLSGLWHGADTTFLLWGGLHGLFLVFEFLADPFLLRLPNLLRRCMTCLCVSFAWVFFRADSAEQAFQIFRSFLTAPNWSGLLTGLGITPEELPLLVGLLLLSGLLGRLPEIGNIAETRDSNILLYCLLVTVVLFARCLALTRGSSPAFLYFRF